MKTNVKLFVMLLLSVGSQIPLSASQCTQSANSCMPALSRSGTLRETQCPASDLELAPTLGLTCNVYISPPKKITRAHDAHKVLFDIRGRFVPSLPVIVPFVKNYLKPLNCAAMRDGAPSSVRNEEIATQFGQESTESLQQDDKSRGATSQNSADLIFADSFPGGVPAAVAACPSQGCVIFATSPRVNRNLGQIDPKAKAITIYLGPYNFTVDKIILRKSLKIVGMGASGGKSGSVPCRVEPCNGTALHSVNPSNAVFVVPQLDNTAATNVSLSGFRVYGAAGNTDQDAFFVDASLLSNSGLWYSTLEDIQIFDFAGVGIHLRGPNGNFGASNQWLRFNNVDVFRAGAGEALRIEGANFQLHFTDCEFDGPGIGMGTNIYIGGYAGNNYAWPFDITFRGLVTQGAASAVQVDGGSTISFHTAHFEKLWGGIQITLSNNTVTQGVNIEDSEFFGDVGVNGGSGYLLNVATSYVFGIRFVHNQIYGFPDSVISSTNLAQVVYRDNFYNAIYFGGPNVPPTSGITTQLSPSSTLNIGGAHSIGLNSSTTPIAIIQSTLGPGEMVTLFMLGGTATFASGGNIALMGLDQLTIDGSITFVRNDLTGSLQWTPVSQWSPNQTGGSAVSNGSHNLGPQ